MTRRPIIPTRRAPRSDRRWRHPPKNRQSSAVHDSLGEDVATALAALVRTVDELPGQFKAEFRLEYWSGVDAPAEAWACTVEGDISGDDGSEFTVLGATAAEVLRLAANEAPRRVPKKPEQ